jgi:predicted DNA-binding transcriptional regulator YafY
MRRADRLFAILQALRGGRLLTAASLAESLEVSVRTIYRDISDLQAGGAPIDGERGVGYLLRDDFFLPPLALTPAEHEAMRWGLALAAAHGDEALSGAAQDVLSKLGVSQAPFHAPPSLTPLQKNLLQGVREALSRSRCLHITYEDSAGTVSARTVRPLGLEHWGRVWTLTAWCESRDDFRVFRIDRMLSFIQGPPFRPESGRTIGDFVLAVRAQSRHQDG